MHQLAKLYPEGWLRYCPRCREYIDQSNPQNDSHRKTVIIDDEPCSKCTEQTKVGDVQNEEEIKEAQAVLGRLGLPKGDSDENKV